MPPPSALSQIWNRHSRDWQAPLLEGSATIALPPGEYVGPVAITRPLTLSGQGERSVIWSPFAPVLLITTPGVVLRQLQIELTTESDGPLIVYWPDCAPILDQVILNGRNEQMNIDHIIDLGWLMPGVETSLPLEFSAEDPWTSLEVAKVNVLPGEAEHNRHGTRGALLTIKPPAGDGYLVESLVLTGDSTVKAQDYVLFGRVGGRPEAANNLMLTTTDGKQVIYCDGGLELSDLQLAYINGGRTSGKPGRNALIVADADGNKALWLATKPADSVSYNGQRLTAWSRRLLEPNDVIRCGSLELKVVERRKPPLQLPRWINFPPIEARSAAAPQILRIESNKNLLENLVSGWQGKIVSLVDWFKLDSSDVRIQANSRTLEIPISLTKEALRCKNGRYVEPAALVLYNDTQVFFIGVSFELNIAPYQLELSPANTSLRFPATPDIKLREGDVAKHVAKFHLENKGSERATCTIQTNVDWLAVPPSALSFVLDGDKGAEISVQLTEAANRLPDGLTVHEGAITITCVESGEALALRAEVLIEAALLPRIRVTNAPAFVPDRYDLAYPERLPLARIEIENGGTADGAYQVRGEGGITISHAAGELARGERVVCEVQLPPEMLAQAAAGQALPIHLSILSGQAGALRQTDGLSLVLQVIDSIPRLVITPDRLNIAGVAGEPIEFNQTVWLENIAQADFRGRLVVGVSWLSLGSPEGVTLKAGAKLSVQVTTNEAARALSADTYVEANAIRVEGDDLQPRQPVRVAATLVLEAAEAHITRHTSLLWFGVVEMGADDKFPDEKLIIGNYGHAPWVGKIEALVDWLSLPSALKGRELVIPPGQVLRLPLQINKGVRALPNGAHYRAEAIAVREVGGSRFSVPARLIITQPAADVSADMTMVAFGKISQGELGLMSAQVTLINQGSLNWPIESIEAPPWLVVVNPSQILAQQSSTVEIKIKPEFLLNTPNHYTGTLRFISTKNSSLALEVALDIVPVKLLVAPLHLIVRPTSSVPASKPKIKTTPTQDNLTIENQGEAPFSLVRMAQDTKGNTANFVVKKWLRFDRKTMSDRVVLGVGEKVNWRVTYDAADPTHPIGEGPTIRIKLPTGDALTIRLTIQE